MMNRITCGVVVSLLLMLWPVAPAVAEEEAPQMIALLEEYHVYPDRAEDFAAYMTEAKEAAAAHGFAYRWDFYALDDLRYLAITWVDGMAGIDEMQAAWAGVMEKWGQEAGAAWAARTSETMSHTSSSVWKPRPDLSYRPSGQADEQAYIVWGLLSIKLGHQDEVEALFREYLGAFAERKVPYGWRAAEIMIGPGYPTLGLRRLGGQPGLVLDAPRRGGEGRGAGCEVSRDLAQDDAAHPRVRLRHGALPEGALLPPGEDGRGVGFSAVS